jgi:ParB family chromosome partitioning protein
MKSSRVELIPISQIRVVNPRDRNKVTFSGIVSNIEKVGLKKPITVTQRDPEADGTRYDLVYGQGRLQAVQKLGDSLIPAIIIEASRENAYLMSLVENIARRRPSNSELVREVRALTKRGYKNTAIAEKLGLDVAYINGVIRLLKKGEDRLIAQVEAGTIPISIAMKLACASTADAKKALSEAYDRGELRGSKFRTLQALIARRFGKDHVTAETTRPVSGKDLVREYEFHTQRQRSLVRRANIVSERLAVLKSAMSRLLADDHFVTLLRAESLDRLPEAFSQRMA